MTFAGFLLTALNFLLLSYYDWDFYASTDDDQYPAIPSWCWIFASINIFVAYTLGETLISLCYRFFIDLRDSQIADGIDGKQARRIGLSGPLGELFDHGLDSYSACLIPVCLYSVFGRGASYSVEPLRFYYAVLVILFNFHVSHWEKYNTGVLYLPWVCGNY
jgi:ethanolaminephosphotransferase